jgi:hypothetical protein
MGNQSLAMAHTRGSAGPRKSAQTATKIMKVVNELDKGLKATSEATNAQMTVTIMVICLRLNPPPSLSVRWLRAGERGACKKVKTIGNSRLAKAPKWNSSA